MVRFLIASYLVFLPVLAFAECDFVTSQYAKELQNPGSVLRLDIEVKKSKKWAMNGLRMILDNREYIHPKWKKKFSAEVQVTYAFGTCVFSAKIRQNGDWRDHQEFKDGELRQSLDVGLKNGNIANAVDFKLFLPHTRIGNNETLAALILRKLGFLAPKTFSVDVAVNGIEGPYLFQEKDAKELLESLGRREGPIFKGDEALLWSLKGFNPMDLLPVSAARLANHKWARRGKNSTDMALSAYIELQAQFMHYASATIDNNRYFLNPNQRLSTSQTFPEYHATIVAFDGWHALWGLNRKFYWNALAGEFEPIYYDGNVSFAALDIPNTMGKRPVEEALFHNHLKDVDFKNLAARISAMQRDEFINEFAVLAKLTPEKAKSFAAPKLAQMVANLGVLDRFSSGQSEHTAPDMDYQEAQSKFLKASANFGLEQRFVTPSSNDVSAGYSFECLETEDCAAIELGLDQVVDLMSKQQYLEGRFVILPSVPATDASILHSETSAGALTVRHSELAKVEYDDVSRHLKLIQAQADDWFIIKNAEIKDMTVSLIGRKAL